MTETVPEPSSGPLPYWQIPLLVLFFLGLVGIVIMTISIFFVMAEWVPSVVEDGTRYYGSDALNEVYFKWLTRALLLAWPVLTVMGIVSERASRRAA